MRAAAALLLPLLLLVGCSSGEEGASPEESQPSASSSSSGSAEGEKDNREGAESPAGEEPAGEEPAGEETVGEETGGEETVGESEPGQGEGAPEEPGSPESPSNADALPVDFPESVPIPGEEARVSSVVASGEGRAKSWAMSFGIAESEWTKPCRAYSSSLTEVGYDSTLKEESPRHVSETLTAESFTVSMSCEKGWMVVLVGPSV